MGFTKTIRNIFDESWRTRKIQKFRINNAIKRIYKQPRFTEGYAYLFGKPFKYHDNLSFIHTYQELFVQNIYEFQPSPEKSIILDCGANMGLSVLYFARNYPDHTIIAFEPDPDIFDLLEENVERFELKNVDLRNKAVWTKAEVLDFYTDHGMGGRVNLGYENQPPRSIEAIRLSELLNEQVDFLKIDIEGAEEAVLRSCKGSLRKVQNLFFEYHNQADSSQSLDELLKLVREEGFKYYLKESAVRGRPFMDTELICEQFDMAINIFCYKS